MAVLVGIDFDTSLDIPTLEKLLEVAESQRDTLYEMGAGWEHMALHWQQTAKWIENTIKIAKGINPYVTEKT